MNAKSDHHDERLPMDDLSEAQEEHVDGDPTGRQTAKNGYPEDKPDDSFADQPEGAAANDLDSELASLARERDELVYELKKATADFHNYVKRSDNQREQQLQFAKGDLLAKFVPVLDHFDTALSQQVQSNDAKQLASGLKIVRDELLKVLKSEGVERLDPEIGDPFDPHQHEALMRQPLDGIAPNHVTAVLQPGYIVKGRTIRPAKVAVAPSD